MSTLCCFFYNIFIFLVKDAYRRSQSPWSDSPGTPTAKQSLSSIKEHDEEEYGKDNSGSQERLEGKEK